MYSSDPRLQYPVRVDKPKPLFGKMLQQAIGGVEGEILSMSSVFLSGLGCTRPEEVSRHVATNRNRGNRSIEMLATAVAPNLEGASVSLQDAAAQDGAVNAVLGG